MNKTYKLIYGIACFIAATFSQPVQAQSWTLPTFSATNDSVAKNTTACAVDGQGNTYWASEYYVNGTAKTGYWIWKVEKNSTILIKKTISLSTPSLSIEPIKSIKVISGSLYVIFNVKKVLAPFDTDACIQKYDLTLTKKWEKIYNGSGGTTQETAHAVIEGPSSGVLLSVNVDNSAAVVNYAKSNGQVINSLIYDNGNSTKETINCILYKDGDLFFAGSNNITASNKIDMFVAKYDSVFVQKWNKITDASANTLYDEVKDLAIDATGNVVVAGDFTSNVGTPRVFYAKYNDSNGSRLWIRRLTNDEINLSAVFTDASSNIMSVVTGSPCRYVTINGSTGALVLSKGIFTSVSINYSITKTIPGKFDELYIIGNYDSIYTSAGVNYLEHGVLVSKLNTTGGRLWNDKNTSIQASQILTASDICFSALNRVFYSSNVTDPSNAPKKFYSYYNNISSTTGIRLAENSVKENSLSLYPNPAHQEFTVNTTSLLKGTAELSFYTVDGKLVKKQSVTLEEDSQTIVVNAEDLSAGMYILSIQQGDQQLTEKLILQ